MASILLITLPVRVYSMRQVLQAARTVSRMVMSLCVEPRNVERTRVVAGWLCGATNLHICINITLRDITNSLSTIWASLRVRSHTIRGLYDFETRGVSLLEDLFQTLCAGQQVNGGKAKFQGYRDGERRNDRIHGESVGCSIAYR